MRRWLVGSEADFHVIAGNDAGSRVGIGSRPTDGRRILSRAVVRQLEQAVEHDREAALAAFVSCWPRVSAGTRCGGSDDRDGSIGEEEAGLAMLREPRPGVEVFGETILDWLRRAERARPEALERAWIRRLRMRVEEVLLERDPDVSDAVDEALAELDRSRPSPLTGVVARKSARRIAGFLATLVRRRNQMARHFGYPDYAEFVLALDDLDGARLRRHLDRFLTLSSKVRQAPAVLSAPVSGVFAGADDRFPAHEAARAVRECLREQLGLDVSTLPLEVHASADEQALCVAVRVPDRIHLRVSERAGGYTAYSTLAHEYGHAAAFAWNEQPVGVLQRERAPMDEGSAQVVAMSVREPAWLMARGLGPPAVRDLLLHANVDQLRRLRRYATIALAEIDLYRAARAGDPPDPRHLPELALRAQVYRQPMYTHSFVLGDAIASQLVAATDGHPSRVLVRRLKHVAWALGGRRSWHDKMRELTGEGLDMAYLAGRLTAEIERWSQPP